MQNNTERWTLEDGRRAERRVSEVLENGVGERVVELHVEDERPLKLKERVVERTKPFVYEREIHSLDNAGNVVEKKVESADPRAKMQLVEHLAVQPVVEAQSVAEDCHVTRDEMVDAIVTAVKSLKSEFASQPVPDAPRAFKRNLSEPPVQGQVANAIAAKLAATGTDAATKFWVAVILAQVCILGYIWFLMPQAGQ